MTFFFEVFDYSYRGSSFPKKSEKFFRPKILISGNKAQLSSGMGLGISVIGKVFHHTSQLSIDLSECIYSIQENFDLKKFDSFLLIDMI